MTLKLRAPVPFPAKVQGTGGIKVSKANAIWTIEPDFGALADFPNTEDISGQEVWVYNPVTGEYKVASVAYLLAKRFIAEPIVRATSTIVVAAGTSVLAIQRAAPAATAIELPSVFQQNGVPLTIIDWSSAVVEHVITMTASAGETIMRQATFPIVSNAVQLTGITLYPSETLSGWFIAP